MTSTELLRADTLNESQSVLGNHMRTPFTTFPDTSLPTPFPFDISYEVQNEALIPRRQS